MMNRWLCALLAAMLLCACVPAGAQDGPAWNERNTWVVYDGELQCLLDDGTRMRFVVEYRRPMYEADAMKCFWLACVPEDRELYDPLMFVALGPDDHDLIFTDDGGYRLLVNEMALKEAYEFRMACESGAE